MQSNTDTQNKKTYVLPIDLQRFSEEFRIFVNYEVMTGFEASEFHAEFPATNETVNCYIYDLIREIVIHVVAQSQAEGIYVQVAGFKFQYKFAEDSFRRICEWIAQRQIDIVEQESQADIGLTTGEIGVANLLANGLTRAEVAKALSVSVSAINSHADNISQKIRDSQNIEKLRQGDLARILRDLGYGGGSP